MKRRYPRLPGRGQALTERQRPCRISPDLEPQITGRVDDETWGKRLVLDTRFAKDKSFVIPIDLPLIRTSNGSSGMNARSFFITHTPSLNTPD